MQYKQKTMNALFYTSYLCNNIKKRVILNLKLCTVAAKNLRRLVNDKYFDK